MVWRFVLQQVEESHRGNGTACGFSADIVKAFNILPRTPALAAAKLMGVDHDTLVAWAGALGGFRRHFVVHLDQWIPGRMRFELRGNVGTY